MKHGYSIIEALISVMILSVVVVMGINILDSSATIENVNRDQVIAKELSKEGYELILNLVKSNQVRFGLQYASTCSLMLPTYSGTADECILSSNNQFKLLPGNFYRIGTDFDNNILSVELVSTNLFTTQDKLSDSKENYLLYLTNIPNTKSSMYNSIPTDTPSKFYRMIQIDKPGSNDLSKNDYNYINIKSVVAWEDRANHYLRVIQNYNIRLYDEK